MANAMKKVPKFVGVCVRVSKKRRHDGKPDKCFYINFQDKNKKKVWEKVGWASDGYSADFAHKTRSERITQIKHGDVIPADLRKEEPLTFADIWEDFYSYAKVNKKSYRDDKFRYDKHIKPVFADRLIRDITPNEIEVLKLSSWRVCLHSLFVIF